MRRLEFLLVCAIALHSLGAGRTARGNTLSLPRVTAEVSLRTRRCKVGAPLQMDLTIRGDVDFARLQPPVLSAHRAMAQRFKISDTLPERTVRPGECQFTYSVRPLRTGTIEVPPLEVSCPVDGRAGYSTVRTEPVPIRVSSDTEAGKPVAVRHDRYRRLSALSVTPLGAEPARVIGAPHAALAFFGPAFYAAVCAGQYLRRRKKQGAKARARSRALAAAQRRLHKARGLGAADPEAARDAVVTALAEYIGAAFGVPHGSVTPPDVVRLLDGRFVDPDVSEQFCAVFGRHFDARYCREQVPPALSAEDADQAEHALLSLDACLRPPEWAGDGPPPEKRPGPATTGVLVATVLLAFWSTRAIASGEAERRFVWREANWRMGTAQTAEDFLLAARTYEELVGTGVRNGPLFYNLGTALLAAEEFDAAVAAFVRSERYMGANAELRRSLTHAFAAAGEHTDVRPWRRVLLFWHYGLAVSARAGVAAVAFSALWIGWSMLRLGRLRVARTLVILSAIALAAFGASALSTWHLESNACTGVKGTVLAPAEER